MNWRISKGELERLMMREWRDKKNSQESGDLLDLFKQ